MALARERVEYHGESYELPIPSGPGKALKLMIPPVQPKIPIYIAAIGPKNTALTGEIADGWLPTFFSPEYMHESRKLLEEGAAKREGGKLPDDFDIAPMVSIAIDDDVDRARDAGPAAARSLRRRHGLAREELLQPAGVALWL